MAGNAARLYLQEGQHLATNRRACYWRAQERRARVTEQSNPPFARKQELISDANKSP